MAPRIGFAPLILAVTGCATFALGGQNPAQPQAAPAAIAAPAPAPAAVPDPVPDPTPAQAHAPDPPGSPPPPEALDGRRYTLAFQNQPAEAVIRKLGQEAKIEVIFLSPATQWITGNLTDLPFEQALARLLKVAGLESRIQEGSYLIGLPLDLQIWAPNHDDAKLDAVYRCRHLDATALATALAAVLPSEIRISPGPKFLSPALDSSNDPSGINDTDHSLRTLNATDQAFKVHDVVMSGPADLVRRAVMLARKFDRPRKQARIDIRIAEVEDNQDRALGLTWMPNQNQAITFNAVEQPTTTGGASVEGIRLGKFSHTPLVVNATLNAMESQGKVKTLANPSILVLDGERSFILSGQKILYPKFTGKDQAGQSIFDVAEVKVGTYLQVAVQIGENEDVVMSIIPQVTNVLKWNDYNGGSYPTISTREAQTTVRANSGEMVVLGGLKSSTDLDNRTGVPFLGSIPLLGRLSSTNRKTQTKAELMIFLTPELVEEHQLGLANHPLKVESRQP